MIETFYFNVEWPKQGKQVKDQPQPTIQVNCYRLNFNEEADGISTSHLGSSPTQVIRLLNGELRRGFSDYRTRPADK